MSDQEDPPRKRVRTGGGGSGTGRSGTARSIGEELGGLDFEPDALLDSLLADDEAPSAAPPAQVLPPPPAEPQIAEAPDAPISKPGQKLLEPSERLYSPDEVTLVGQIKDGEPSVDGEVSAVAVFADVDDLLESRKAKPLPPEPPPLKRPPPIRPAPPSIPRPAGRPPPPPRPRPVEPAPEPAEEGPTLAGVEMEELQDASFETLGGGGTLGEEAPEDLDETEFEEIGAEATSTDVERPSTRDEPTVPPAPPDDEIAYGAELPEPHFEHARTESRDEVEDDATTVLQRSDLPEGLEAPSEIDELDREVDAMLGGSAPSLPDARDTQIEDAELRSELSSADLEAEPVEEDYEAGEIAASGDEQPAAARLAEGGELAAWISRAQWIEAEAQAIADPQARARALVVASELWAMAGDLARAREVASEAGSLAASMPVVGRQLRHLAAAESDWNAVAAALETETRASPNVEARAHAVHLSAELSRLLLGDEAGAQKRLDLLTRTAPADARAHVAKLATQLGTSPQPPKQRLVDAPGLERLTEAFHDLCRLRGGAVGPEAGEPSMAAWFEEARRALAAGDRARAGAAVARLSGVEGLEVGAAWLAAALLAVDGATRPAAIALLGKVLERERSTAAERALASRALEQGDSSAVAIAIGSQSGEAFSAADRVALGALTGGGREAVQPWLATLAASPELRALAAAGSSIVLAPDAVPEVLAGSERSRSEVALGRTVLAAKSDEHGASSFRMAHEAHAIVHPGEPLAQSLALDLALAERAAERVAHALAEWPQTGDDNAASRDRHLAAAIVYEIAKDPDAAARALAAALSADPACEAAVRALVAGAPATGSADLLVALAEVEEEPSTRALFLTEAALRIGPEAGERHQRLLEQAAEAAPNMPLPHRLAEQLARSRGDVEGLLRWLRTRRDSSEDSVERALDMVREALLVVESDFELATSLLEEAVKARPLDVALRELHERLAGGTSPARGAWREEVAEGIEGPDKARLLVEAALEYESAGDLESAARAAEKAHQVDGSEFARIIAERNAAQGKGGAGLAERLFAQAREEPDPARQRELYERLSEIDSARGEHSSALLWQSAIFERTPDHLPALRRLEHAYVSAGREEDLEPIAAALAKLLDRGEVTAHAMIAARLRIRAGNWASARELVDLAFRQEHPSLWALRAQSAHARVAGDDATQLDADRQLSERANRAIDAATLALRAAEAATRVRRMDLAKELLDRAVEMVPEHPVALTTLAEVAEATGDARGAAEAMESVAQGSSVRQHRLEAWYSAAVSWLDHVKDDARGRAALERAAEIDIRHQDVFERLRALYVAAGDRAKLAELIEQRLQHTESPEERVALEISRGRALAEVGDHAAAKLALAAALDANPDNADALDAFADLCVAEHDWSGAEQAWIRLARHVSEAERQTEIYRKLGNLYDTELPNPQRAELAYREVLKREPNDIGALERLIQVHARLGEPDKAAEIANQLLERAVSADEKRDRTIGLAEVYEQVLGDRRKAEGVLDKARRSWPQDGKVLRALAEFHQRGNETKALGMLLDRAANDARRALATGRFDPSFFEVLSTVAELRGGADAAAIAKATLAALEGRDSTMRGAGPAAGDPRLDDLLAPELLTLPLRALLKKAGDGLDSAYPVDLRALRATPLPNEAAAVSGLVQQLAGAFGMHNVEVLVSSALGAVCIPASSVPPRVVFGQAMLDSADDAVRFFAIVRAMKILQGRASALSRLAPIDLWPVMAAFLSLFAPNWQPAGVDAKRMADAAQRIRPVMPRRLDDDVPVLALEVTGSIGNRASQLAIAIGQWGDRAGLLAIGDPSVAIRGIAASSGHADGPPAAGADRLKWIVRNPEARDLAIFSVSEQYAEARRRLGLT